MKNKSLLILLWFIVIVLQLAQILFASTISYLFFGNEILSWIGRNLFNVLVYGGGVASFPIVGYLLHKTSNYFKSRSISLIKVIIWSIVIGLVSLLRFFFPFGVDFAALIMLVITVMIIVDIYRLKS